MSKISKPDETWKEELTDAQYQVTRCGGTERAFTGQYWNHKADGIYTCICCGHPLFDSKAKYDSGTGWPSFYEPVQAGIIDEKADVTYGMRRTEVRCNQCDAHLGHVFDDGPKPTGLRYCINSASLAFQGRDASTKSA